jgi:IS5 family transposase
MLRERTVQRDYWDFILPESARVMSPELQAVDELLDDERFMRPFRLAFTSTRGRPTIPIEVYVRLMYLKFRYKMGYETLVAEVDTNISWRLFCRLGLASQVPDASTLSKLTKGKAKAAVAQLNDALLTKLAEQGKVKGRRMRTDTTVLPANIAYPTDIGLLADGLRVIGRNLAKLRGLGTVAGAAVEAVSQQMDRTRAKVKEQLRGLSQRLKQKDRPAGVRQEATQAVLDVAEETVEQVTAALTQVQIPELGRVEQRLAQSVQAGLAVVRRLAEQTKQVLSGNPHVKNRVVTVFDQAARPIRKGKLKVPTEFGRTVRVDQSEDGYITGYAVHIGSPGDSTQMVPAVEHHRAVFGRVPDQVAADRGMGCPSNDRKLAKLGVTDICLPQSGPLSDARKAVESEPTFAELKKWRAGVEALISLMKRVFGWDRCLFEGTAGAEAWMDWSVLAHNLRLYGRRAPQPC